MMRFIYDGLSGNDEVKREEFSIKKEVMNGPEFRKGSIGRTWEEKGGQSHQSQRFFDSPTRKERKTEKVVDVLLMPRGISKNRVYLVGNRVKVK